MHRLFLQKHYFYMKLTESSQEDNRFFASIGYCISTGNGAATVTLEHDSSSHQNDTPNAPTCYRKQVGVTFLCGRVGLPRERASGCLSANGILPDALSFSCPKRKRKGRTPRKDAACQKMTNLNSTTKQNQDAPPFHKGTPWFLFCAVSPAPGTPARFPPGERCGRSCFRS